MSDTLSDGFNVISETSSQGQAGFPNNVIAANLGDNPPGRSATVQFVISRTKAGAAPDVAVVGSDQPDPYPLNNVAINGIGIIVASLIRPSGKPVKR